MPEKNDPKGGNTMLVVILGSGTCVPSLLRSSCAVLAQINNRNLLLDIGPGTMRRLTQIGVDIADISYLFLSHFHPDHSGELASFLFSRKYGNIKKANSPLTLVGGNGLIHFFKGLQRVYGPWIEFERDIPTVLEMNHQQNDPIPCEDFTVTSASVSHNEESLAFRITDLSGNSFVYSGDTDYCESLVQLASDTDVLICESSFPDNQKVPGHLTPSLAGDIARRANARQLVLTHFYPECNHIDLEKECRKTYEGPLLIAEDLMEIKLDYN